MKLARLAPALVLLFGSACAPRPAAPPARLSIVEPPPGRLLAESYPAPSSPADPVKRDVLDRINRDRADAGLSSVAWDEGASRVADAFCAAQAAEKTTGHYLRDGIPPYARTGLAGIFGYQAENSASWTTTGSSFQETPSVLALSAHRSMMREYPPHDGHRRTILDPEVTHVGVGWAMRGERFQMAEEFLTRHLARLALRADAGVVRVEGAPQPPMRLRFVTAAREPLPVSLSQAEATARITYRYPSPTEAYVAEGEKMLRVGGVATIDRIRFGHDRDFSLIFAPSEPGLWTLVFWCGQSEAEQARPGGSAVVRVQAP